MSLLRGKNVEILNAIRDSRDLSDDTAGKLKAVVEAFSQDAGLSSSTLWCVGHKSRTRLPGTRPGMTKKGFVAGSTIRPPG